MSFLKRWQHITTKNGLEIKENPKAPDWGDWKKTIQYQSDRKGSLINSTRVFGVEIECMTPTYPTPDDPTLAYIYNHFNSSLGLGLDGGGVEWKTPRLAGSKGEKYITDLTELLNHYKYDVKNTCGLHIHLSGGDDFIAAKGDSKVTIETKFKNLKRLMLFYMEYEEVVQSFLPFSRRNSGVCGTITKNMNVKDIDKATTQIDLEKIWYRLVNYNPENNSSHLYYRAPSLDKLLESYKKNTKSGNGYRPGFNLNPLFGDNHIEIRFHPGTISGRKILEWVNLHLTILDRIVVTDPAKKTGFDTGHHTLPHKTEAFFRFLQLTPSSIEYFLGRQQKFAIVHPKLPRPNMELVEAILTEDNEILV